MAIHDWTRVDPRIYHAMHTTWMGQIQNTLNEGVLPDGYYALAEQHVGRPITDILTLHASASGEPRQPMPPTTGGTAIAAKPPRMQRRRTMEGSLLARQRSLAIRHVKVDIG